MAHLDLMQARQFAHGALDDTSRLRCEAHLRECEACRRLVDEVRHIGALLRLDSGAGDVQCDVDRLVGRIQVLAGPGAAGRRRWRTTLTGAAAALVCGVAAGAAGRLWLTSGDAASDPSADPAAAYASELATLAANPWLIDNYMLVRTFDQLLTEKER
ncbi:hypothetical protein RAS1_41080 [Phycisphaerae bacterium RAS1]|nr:hypothetical protein RAS1_41080 [Phycisphaerae bacterium RAS1]